MATGKQNRDFEDSIFEDTRLLDKAIEWIQVNMKPNQVFVDESLDEWAKDNGYVKPE